MCARAAARVVLAAACVGAAVSACAVSLPGPDHEFHNYQTAVAQAPKQGWTAYWLGRSFEAGGMTFKGPSVPDFGQVGDGTVTMSYDSGAHGDFYISLFTTAVWRDQAAKGSDGMAPGATRVAITIAGAPATVTTGPVHNEGVRIDIDYPDTHVLARVGPSFGENNVDVNKLDEQTLLAVLQHLRPYPK
jgi:hypothetical protein